MARIKNFLTPQWLKEFEELKRQAASDKRQAPKATSNKRLQPEVASNKPQAPSDDKYKPQASSDKQQAS